MPMLDDAMRRTIAAQLQTRLLHNRELRHSLLIDPKTTLAKEFGVRVPDDLHVTVVENTPFHQYVALPAQPDTATADVQSGAEDEFEALVQQRAAQDEAFRQQALADPKGALEALLHFKLPAQMTITALEDTPQTWHIVCPPLTDLLAEELDDQALEAVAGGASALNPTVCTSGGSGAPNTKSNQHFHRPRYPICH